MFRLLRADLCSTHSGSSGRLHQTKRSMMSCGELHLGSTATFVVDSPWKDLIFGYSTNSSREEDRLLAQAGSTQVEKCLPLLAVIKELLI